MSSFMGLFRIRRVRSASNARIAWRLQMLKDRYDMTTGTSTPRRLARESLEAEIVELLAECERRELAGLWPGTEESRTQRVEQPEELEVARNVAIEEPEGRRHVGSATEVHCDHCGTPYLQDESPISDQPEYEATFEGLPTCEYCGSYLPPQRVRISPGMFCVELAYWKVAGGRMNDAHPAARYVVDPTAPLREVHVGRAITLMSAIAAAESPGGTRRDRSSRVRALVTECLGDGELVRAILKRDLP
jgi:hypothetical protein